MWIQTLRRVTDDNNKKLRNEHLKLLLFALHRRALVGVFEYRPPEELECFHDGLTLQEMTRELIEITEARKAQNTDKNIDPLAPTLPIVVTNLSHDLKTYSAAQQIPKFGAHVYFAVSKEPIQMWRKSASNYPQMGELPNPQQWEIAFAKMDDGVLGRQAEVDKAIALAKALEAGDITEDELEPEIDFSKKITIKPAQTIHFKWKKDSLLNTHQTYDFSDVGTPENIVLQGRSQLEMDEGAFHVLDNSLPGRQRIVVRDPFYNDLPSDLAERRLHGVNEELELQPKNDDGFEEIPVKGQSDKCGRVEFSNTNTDCNQYLQNNKSSDGKGERKCSQRLSGALDEDENRPLGRGYTDGNPNGSPGEIKVSSLNAMNRKLNLSATKKSGCN